MTTNDEAASAPVFDVAALWRADIITEFRLRGAERCAAASPAPGFPQLLDSLLASLDPVATRWLDVGGGLGGIASWLERTSAARVVVIDPSERSLIAARRLFPTLLVCVGTSDCLPVGDGSVDVVMLNGVVSLLDELTGLVVEARRVLAPNGHVLVTDIWSATNDTLTVAPNIFHSLESFAASWIEAGFGVRHVAIADTSTGWWASAATQVKDEIVVRHANDAGFAQWHDDMCHIQSVIESGRIMAAGMLLVPSVELEEAPTRRWPQDDALTASPDAGDD